MAAYTNNDGTQTITFSYEQEATSSSFNNLLYGLMKPGIYEGGLLSRVNDTTISLASYIAVVEANNVDSVAIRVETISAYDVTVSTTNTVVVLRYEWHSIDVNYVQAVAVAPGSVETTDVVVGICDFTGSVLSETFIYDDATNPREQISKDADTILLGDSYSVSSTPTGGTSSSFTGNVTYITEVIQDLYERLIDLSGVQNTAVKNRHVDLNISTGIDGADISLGSGLTYQGVSPGSIANTIKITTALQSIINLISDLSGASDDTVTRRLLNFGTASDEISLKDFVIGLSGSQVMDGDFTDYSYAIGTVINTALDNLASIVNEIAASLNTEASSIDTLQSNVATLQAKKTLDDLPIGTILMYDGTSWVDNSTLAGWYACTYANYSAGRTPNLEDRFIKGEAPSEHETNFSDNLHGTSSITLTLNNIPQHSHTFSSTTSGGTTSASGRHTHSYSIGVREDKTRSGSGKVQVNHASASTSEPLDDGSGDTIGPGDTINHGRHTHTIPGLAYSGTTSNTGQASPTALTINPAHYSLIFVRKVS